MLMVGTLRHSLEIQGRPDAQRCRSFTREVWSLCKGEHTATAIVTVIPQGQELVLYVDGWVVGSQLFRHNDRALDDLAIEHCEAFEARGWTAPR